MELVWLWDGLLQVKFRSEANRPSSSGAASRGSGNLIHHQLMAAAH